MFLKGFYANKSFKKIVRRKLNNIFEKTNEKNRLYSEYVKFFIFNKKFSNLSINKNLMYFRRNFGVRFNSVKRILSNHLLKFNKKVPSQKETANKQKQLFFQLLSIISKRSI